MVRHLFERNRVIVLDAAVADFIAVTVQKGDRQFRALEPVLIRGLPERRNGKRQHEKEGAGAPGGSLRKRFDQNPAAPAGDVEPIHNGGEALVKFARPLPGPENGKIDPGVEVEQQQFDSAAPVAIWSRSPFAHFKSLPGTGFVLSHCLLSTI